MNAAAFPLVRQPGVVAVLDDNEDYVRSLAVLLPQKWPVKQFTRPRRAVDFIKGQLQLWEHDATAQQAMVNGWRSWGAPLVPQVLSYWAVTPERYSLARVLIVDYSMPDMSGLAVLKELNSWPGARLLLTGQADERVAVEAFNGNLIDRFLRKHDPEIIRVLGSEVQSFMDLPWGRQEHTWLSTLTTEQIEILHRSDVNHTLALMAAPWVEHVAIGQPFGILARESSGRVIWLQLEPRSNLQQHAQMAAEAGLSGDDVDHIVSGRCLAQVGTHLHPLEERRAEPAIWIGGDVLGAIFAVPADHLPAPIESYSNWKRRQVD